MNFKSCAERFLQRYGRARTVAVIGGNRLGLGMVFVVAIVVNLCAAPTVKAQNAYSQHNLVSDLPGVADNTDTNLVNPWGISLTATSPFWISDNGSGLSTVYNGLGQIQPRVVAIPPPAGAPPAAPTGIVFNGTMGFPVGPTNAPARFIFATEDGTLSGWASGTSAVLKVDNSASDAVYKGLTSGTNSGGIYLFATDFHNGKIDVFDTNWAAATLAGAFADPTIPAGYAPFGIQNVNGQLFVTYALQDALKHDDANGPGHGYVDVFDTSGNLIERFASTNALNSPWGIALAPTGFGAFGGDLLVANFGDGRINAYDPTNGLWLGALNDTSGNPFSVAGLWGIAFGNGGNGGDAHTLYFTAGIAGPDAVEDHGLFGSLSAVFPAITSGVSYSQHNLVSDLTGMADNTDTNLVNPWGISFSATSPFWIADNGSGLSTLYNSAGQPQSLVVTIPPPAGGVSPAAPTGTIFNGTQGFPVGPTNAPAHFIFTTEDGTLSGWASGADAVLKVDNSASGTVYKGLASGTNNGGTYLYATDFHNGKIDVFDTNWAAATLAGAFADSTIPAGYAPFGIQNVNGQLFVTYALQDALKHDDANGPGHGYVNVFDTSGNLLERFASTNALNSPWGIALAPTGFGAFGGDLLIANFGDGRINAYDLKTDAWVGNLYDSSGNPFSVAGLWGIAFGNGGNGGDAHTLYFTAGIAGPDAVEDHGLFGSLTPIFPTFTSIRSTGTNIVLNWAGGTGVFQVQSKAGLLMSNWVEVLTTTNHAASVTNNAASNFFRLLLQ